MRDAENEFCKRLLCSLIIEIDIGQQTTFKVVGNSIVDHDEIMPYRLADSIVGFIQCRHLAIDKDGIVIADISLKQPANEHQSIDDRLSFPRTHKSGTHVERDIFITILLLPKLRHFVTQLSLFERFGQEKQ